LANWLSGIANPFRVGQKGFVVNPGLSLRSNHWAEISQRLRRRANGFGVRNAFGVEATRAFGVKAAVKAFGLEAAVKASS
jgi:hypothetical protein